MILMVFSDMTIRTLFSLFSSFIISIMHAGMHALNFHRMPLRGHRHACETVPAFQEFGNLIFVSTSCKSSHFKCICLCMCKCVCTHINKQALSCSHLSDDCLLS